MPPSLALCVATPNWLGTAHVPRLLEQSGYAVTLLAHPRSYAAKSSRIERLVPATWDPAANVERLREHLAAQTVPYELVLLADDPTLWEVLRRRGEAWTAGVVPTDPSGPGAELLLSKARFMEESARRGLPVPPSLTAASREALGGAAARIGFPVLVKPIRASGGRGAFVARSSDELLKAARSAEESAFLVQRHIAGPLGSTVVLYDHGAPRAWLSSYKRMVFPEPHGPSSARQRVHLHGMEEVLAGFGRMLGFHGLAGFYWVQPDEGGPALILECNGRPSPYMNIISHLGLDLAGAIRALRLGERRRTPPPETPGEEIAIFPQNAEHAIAASDWKRLASWLLAPPGPLPWDEPRLFAAHLRLLAGQLARKAFT